MATAEIIIAGMSLYGGIGLAVALGFVTLGILRAMPDAGPVTWGARMLLLPGARRRPQHRSRPAAGP